MSKLIKLTLAECNHINILLDRNIDDGVYSGNKKQYWNRHQRIRNKLEQALATADGK